MGKRTQIVVGTASALSVIGLLAGVGMATLTPPAARCRGPIHFGDPRLASAVRAAVAPPTQMLTRGPSWARTETCSRLGGDLDCARYVPRLQIDGLGIRTLDGLECLTSLQRLVVSGNRLTTLEPLAGSAHLESLDATRNAITDLVALTAHPRLAELYLWHNSITDVSPLSSLPRLAVLDVRANPLDCPTQRRWLDELRTRGVRVLDDCGGAGAVAPRR
jgi:hypothetical protein